MTNEAKLTPYINVMDQRRARWARAKAQFRREVTERKVERCKGCGFILGVRVERSGLSGICDECRPDAAED